MHPIDRSLARPSSAWRADEQRAAWHELVALLDALPADEVERLVPSIDDRLTRAYEDGGASGVWLEDDQRVAPIHWCLPAPRPALPLAREVAIDLDADRCTEDALLALARSPLTRPITRASIRGGLLEPILDELLRTPLADGLGTLSVRGALIGGSDGAARIAAAPALSSLAVLDLAFCNVHEDGIEALLASPHLTRLAWIVVDANCIDPYGERGQAYRDDLDERLAGRAIEMEFV